MTLTLAQVLEFLDTAADRVGIDKDRRRMMQQIFIYGEPVEPVMPFRPLPDVQTLKLALETVQTWFNARPSQSPHLNASVMMQMQGAGYPIEGGVL